MNNNPFPNVPRASTVPDLRRTNTLLRTPVARSQSLISIPATLTDKAVPAGNLLQRIGVVSAPSTIRRHLSVTVIVQSGFWEYGYPGHTGWDTTCPEAQITDLKGNINLDNDYTWRKLESLLNNENRTVIRVFPTTPNAQMSGLAICLLRLPSPKRSFKLVVNMALPCQRKIPKGCIPSPDIFNHEISEIIFLLKKASPKAKEQFKLERLGPHNIGYLQEAMTPMGLFLKKGGRVTLVGTEQFCSSYFGEPTWSPSSFEKPPPLTSSDAPRMLKEIFKRCDDTSAYDAHLRSKNLVFKSHSKYKSDAKTTYRLECCVLDSTHHRS